jgi:hypothetical protein
MAAKSEVTRISAIEDVPTDVTNAELTPARSPTIITPTDRRVIV